MTFEVVVTHHVAAETWLYFYAGLILLVMSMYVLLLIGDFFAGLLEEWWRVHVKGQSQQADRLKPKHQNTSVSSRNEPNHR